MIHLTLLMSTINALSVDDKLKDENVMSSPVLSSFVGHDVWWGSLRMHL